jgi:hypothetical protein
MTFVDPEIQRAMDEIRGRRAKEHGPNGHATAPPLPTTAIGLEGVSVDDFHAYMPMHNYIYAPTRDTWPASSVNSRIKPIQNGVDKDGEPQFIAANQWLDRNKPVEQLTWAPGMPMLIRSRLIADGGWIEREGVNCFNLYRPPTLQLGDPTRAVKWVAHVRRVYPEDADHIIKWLAHRRQHPAVKINHGLVLGGAQGIGKDSLLEPVKRAIGPWNFSEIMPVHLFGNFNGFLRSVILRISEARDLGDVDRYQLYEHLKAYMAAPPDVLRVNEKHLREYALLNCCGVIITTNHKTDGIYLPSDDRRHYVAWSDLTKEDFNEEYWIDLWRWYDDGGAGHVAAYLDKLDLSTFNAKAPPPKTPAFWAVVDASHPVEDAELADCLDALGNPHAVALGSIIGVAHPGFGEWLTERKHRRIIPHRMDKCGYEPVRNPDAADGLWKHDSRRQVIYARKELSTRERLEAVTELLR